MAELDFVNFGVRLNGEFLRRASEALSELYEFGDLKLRSVWLYYGSLAAVSKAFGGSARTFLRALKENPRHLNLKHLRLKAHCFAEMSDEELDIIRDGSQMMMEMPRAERGLLFPPNNRPSLTKEKFIARVESWRKAQSGEWRAGYGFENLPVPSAVELVKSYVDSWNFWTQFKKFDENGRTERPFRIYECGVLSRSLKRALMCRAEIEDRAGDLEICSIALEILREYEISQEQFAATRKHMEVQRRILKSRYGYFHNAVVERDGLFCSRPSCLSTDNLQLDHIKPVSLGGTSDLENLQLLCGTCNMEKGATEKDYRSNQPAI